MTFLEFLNSLSYPLGYISGPTLVSAVVTVIGTFIFDREFLKEVKPVFVPIIKVSTLGTVLAILLSFV